MILSTERLILRPLESSDEDEIFLLRSDEEVNRYIDRPRPASKKDAEAFIIRIQKGVASGESYYWGITLKNDTTLVGTICLWNLSADKKYGEIGYELSPSQQGKGIMKEAMKAVINYAFETIGITTLEAYTHKDNTASTKLLQHFGFKAVPLKKDADNENNVIWQKTSNVSP